METKTSVIWGATYLRVLPVIAAMAISAAFPMPAGATNVSSPNAVYNPYRDRIDVFVTGDDGNLYDNLDQQTPTDSVGVVAPLSAIFQPTFNRIHVFVAGTDGNLWVKYWDGGWKWQNQGTPQ
jgi:hypothetical protein